MYQKNYCKDLHLDVDFFFLCKLKVGHRGRGDDDGDTEEDSEHSKIQKINKQPKDASGRNKYALQFFQESKEELIKRREEGRKTIVPISFKDQEVSDNYFPDGINIPKRPSWDFSMSKEQLEAREQKYFFVRHYF